MEPVLTREQIAAFAAAAGFTAPDLAIAVAIALAESSGNINALGDTELTPGGSVGLWQINLRWHPEYTAEMLADPQTNANAAFAIYTAAGHSFIPWSTYKSGAYVAHL
jgi:Lysozyme like domain